MTDLSDFIAGLPKAELHVHHVGSASLETVVKLAERHAGTTSVPTDPEGLVEFFTFTDFAHFIEVYLATVDLLRTPDDLWTLTYDVARGLADQRVRYVELTCTPYTSMQVGVAAEAYVEALEDARRRAEADFGLQMRWIFDIPGESGVPSADVTLDVALRLQPDGLVGFGLGGPEIGVPRPQFTPHFDAARAAGLHSVPHAGESTGPQTIRDALDHLGAERIGHGIAAAQDPALMERLAREGIVLEVSPTSNVCTRSVPSLEEHPLPLLAAAGVPFTINSDDPPMFGTTLNREYQVAADLLGLDEAGVADLARAAVNASFAPAEVKTQILNEITAYAGQ
ncbi:MAG TPA: adenosine deaminase [Aeromicrobium sp.]|nr:adenosine deaminase [Aeromicrobium sp.]